MESVKNEKSNTVDEPSKKKLAPVMDRVSISRAESEKLDLYLEQVQKSSRGFLSLTKSDIVNFLIRDHKADLSPKELAQIRADKYEPIRHINWITQELKSALVKNDLDMVATLQEEIKGVELSVVLGAQEFNRAKANGLEPAPLRRRRRQKAEGMNPTKGSAIGDLKEKDTEEKKSFD